MDFKAITWAGNIYQKFEAMCLEVEEVMYEDTVKFVENQVEKVGGSVKKLYSEIMQDLLPTSCVDPVKLGAGDLPLKPYTQIDINKKPKSTILDRKETNNEDDYNISAEESSLNLQNDDANPLTPLHPSVLVENTRSDVCCRKSKKGRIGIKRISKNKGPPKTSHQSGDESSLVVCDMRSNWLVASDDMNVKRSSEFFVRNDDGEAVAEHIPICDASDQSFSCDQNISAESICTPTTAKFERKDVVEKSKLEESCILVEMDDLYLASQGTTKHKSYKKKIREALSSKLRSTRKQDHHVFHYKDSGLVTPTLTSPHSCESDWELL